MINRFTVPNLYDCTKHLSNVASRKIQPELILKNAQILSTYTNRILQNKEEIEDVVNAQTTNLQSRDAVLRTAWPQDDESNAEVNTEGWDEENKNGRKSVMSPNADSPFQVSYFSNNQPQGPTEEQLEQERTDDIVDMY